MASSRARALPWLVLAAIILCTALIRIRLIDIPLERDEGEYALAGQLILHGVPPYREAWNMKFPGTYAAYALIMLLLGQTIRGIHAGLLVVNAVTTVMLFLIAKRFFPPAAALAACAAFELLSVGEGVLGPMAHATHFVILFAVAGTLLLFRAIDAGSMSRLFVSGLCFGTAVLMKQHGALIGCFGGAWIVWTVARAGIRPVRKAVATAARRLFWFGAGCILPVGATFVLLWRLGVFERFWFWTFRYAREYSAENTLADGWWYLGETLPDIVKPNAALWILAGAGLILIWLGKDKLGTALPLTLFLFFSILAVCPGLYFREHYFVLMLPAFALLVGAAVNEGSRRLPSNTALWICGAALAASLWQQRDFLFRMNPLQASREEYGITPFPEAIRVAAYIRSHSSPDTRIAVLGSEPEVYFYADRRPATGYMYTYALMEDQPYAATMQDEMIHELEETKPEYVVMIGGDDSWMVGADSVKKIFDWWKVYEQQHYDTVGVVDIMSYKRTDYWWDAAAANRKPRAGENFVISRRKIGAQGQ